MRAVVVGADVGLRVLEKAHLVRLPEIAFDTLFVQKGAQHAAEDASPRLFSLDLFWMRFRSASLRGDSYYALQVKKEP